MVWWIFAILLYIILVVSFHIYIRTYGDPSSFQSDSLPVVIEPWYFPFFGPVLSMKTLKKSVRKWKKKYGENFTIRIFGRNLTIITKASDLKRFYHAGEDSLSLIRAALTTLGDGYPEKQFIVDYNAVHYLLLVFSTENLRFMLLNMDKALRDYFDPQVGLFWMKNGNSTVVDLFPFIYRLIIRMNCQNFTSSRIYKGHVEEWIDLFSNLDAERSITNPIGEALKRRIGFFNKQKQFWARWLEILNPDVERCLKMIENGIEPIEMDLLYSSVKYAKDELEKRGEKFTNRLVGFLVYSSFLPAQLNTYATSSFVLLEYVRHKNDKIGEQIENEIENFSSNGEPNFENFSRMEFINGCINEVIRIRTNNQLVVRQVQNDFVLSDGRKVVKDNIICSLWGDNEDLFERPENFEPDRHLSPREENKRDLYRFLPFGRGKHPCTGERYVKLQIKMILSYFLRFSEFEICEQSRDFESLVDHNQLAAINRPNKPVFVRISKKEIGP